MRTLEEYCDSNDICNCKGELLANHTTFRIGGEAGLFIEPSSEKQIAELAIFCRQKQIPVLILGHGSNTLFPDSGFGGAVIHLGSRFAAVELVGETTIRAQAGASLKSMCELAAAHGLTGLEFAYGIPGSVGGAVVMNAGAYGGEMKDVVTAVRHIDNSGKLDCFTDKQLAFSYRHSAYSEGGKIIVGADISLRKADPSAIRSTMADFLNRRQQKQPLELPSAGSTFRRPEGGYASELIDRCGLKGLRVGGAMVSEKHAGFVVNAGGATCADVLALIAEIQRIVREKTGFELQPEVRIISE